MVACQIGLYNRKDLPIEEFAVLVYRHSNGDPRSVKKSILPFLKDTQFSGDVEYLAAGLIQHLCNEHDKRLVELVGKEKLSSYCFGCGVGKKLYTDIQCFYKIFPDYRGIYTLQAYSVYYDKGKMTFDLID